MDTPVAEDVVLGGRYRLVALLGAGGMAQVFDGWDQRLDRPVAVKLLRTDLAAQAGLRERFQLEGRAAARLIHPNVVAVYDAGEDRGRSYIVMERLRGESLADVIARGPVDQAWLLRLAGEVLAALGAAHQAGIIHRDIKPANILLGPDGRAKVADFGIARVVEAQFGASGAASDAEPAVVTGIGLVLGTPAYLAPERAMGDPATPRSDVYSLGVVLYEALTGRKPYAGNSAVAVASAALARAAENPYQLRPDADPQLVAVIGRAMAADPALRYGSADEMARDLRRPAPSPTAIMRAGVDPRRDAPISPASVGPASGSVARPPGSVTPLPGLSPAPSPGAPLGSTVPLPAALPPAPPDSSTLRRFRTWPRRVVGAGVTAAIVAVVLALALHGADPLSEAGGSPPATSPSTTSATVPTPSTTTSLPPSPTTTPTVVDSQTDPVAEALLAWANHLSDSTSTAARQLIEGLNKVAAADPSDRASLASSLLNRTIGWYKAGELSSVEYAGTASLLQLAGAPAGPPPTAKRHPPTPGGGIGQGASVAEPGGGGA